MNKKTEDAVKSDACRILGFAMPPEMESGVGQNTTFNNLGFKGVADCPDGWYLPAEFYRPAIILEVKSERVNLTEKHRQELRKNVSIARTKYQKIIGILYNGIDVEVYKDGVLLENETELRNKEYYFSLYSRNTIDRGLIYSLTKSINDSLRVNFSIDNLYHRMIFTACALVAKRYGALLAHDMSFGLFSRSISEKLTESLSKDLEKNIKLKTLLDVYSQIKPNKESSREAINKFIDDITQISDCINSDYWNGEDVMAIFFNEFNRYQKKPENGQVFTPDHITSLMYRITDTHKNDTVLDAACGSGAFLVKAMCNMVSEAGGPASVESVKIPDQLYGIENHREIYALACANMLIHKDGKTNLVDKDSRTKDACEWIKSKKIKRVLMNPPFENKFGCLEIVKNVLDNVEERAVCAFILPDQKLNKNPGMTKAILKAHRLEKIVKLPETIFPGTVTSIFVFTAGVAHGKNKIFSCYIDHDGLETVKNQGRQDVRDSWAQMEDYWVDVIKRQSGDDSICWLEPDGRLSYPMPEKKFEITTSDFVETVLNYKLYSENIEEVRFKEFISGRLLYGCCNDGERRLIRSFLAVTRNPIDTSGWKMFTVGDVFNIRKRPAKRSKLNYEVGRVPFVASGNRHNGVECYLNPKEGEVLDRGGCITLSPVDGSSFYQETDFLGRGGAGSSIIMLDAKEKVNRRRALFLCTVLRVICSKFKFTDMANSRDLPDERLCLPVNDGQEIDWNTIETFIKQTEAKIHKIIKCYQEVGGC